MFPADRLELVERYGQLLATDGVVRGLIGPREVPRLWDRHVVNCALLATALPREATVADIGSGAGLPGLVIALARPDVRVTLVEPLLRRTTFLEEVVVSLGLGNVVVRRDRAEALHGNQTFDVVTARAVAPLERLLRWCMPLVAPAGALLAMKGESAEEEVATASAVLRTLGCAVPTIEVLTIPATPPGDTSSPGADGTPETRVVRVTWSDPARVSLPTSGGRGGSRAGQRRTPRTKRRRT
ncbi:16S rRNA (guanine(527)-N(7))-methyltransferase RsmG [Nocardioides antri]|uniref:Ribosomal RNA small subunit methyltransferase G n=1 Tax=Nocardioides antri TaxID=2607659 RepID=A0A5B1M2J7_9ACTN|nr:16S rRNA (guanine(527)-N(7))-methyltransferase RsmG [Nocardioides antri]